jgi:hypothetical protein
MIFSLVVADVNEPESTKRATRMIKPSASSVMSAFSAPVKPWLSAKNLRNDFIGSSFLCSGASARARDRFTAT